MKAEVFRDLLIETGYDKTKTNFIYEGFSQGFSLEYAGLKEVKLKSRNLKLPQHLGTKTTLWNKVMKEVEAKRYAGPFESIPYEFFIQSPIGLVPKDNGKSVRLIFHLSHPRGKTNQSVNANTPKDKSRVKYPDFSKAIELCRKCGIGCKLLRSDVRSAFRNLGLRKSDWCYLIMMAESPFDQKVYYFVDKCLPFGASISCSRFQAVSDGIAHIIKKKSKSDNVNYLDDFLFIALLKALCDRQVSLFLQVCDQIGLPISIEKTFWGSTQMTFLGFLIDTVRQIVLIPIEKLDKGKALIARVLTKRSKKLTMKELQSICGFLNFLGRCIVPGRAFTRRLYTFINTKLKPHHHIRINQEMRRDLEMWQMFLSNQSAYARGVYGFFRFRVSTGDFYVFRCIKIKNLRDGGDLSEFMDLRSMARELH